jgi:2'-5' RNA ligase
METIRTFIAVDFPLEIKEKITEITAFFQTKLLPAQIKWVDPEHMHLTLKFMGETPLDKLVQIKQSIHQVVSGFPSFKIEIKALGMYPNIKRPRVIWLGINDENNLILLHNQLDQALKDEGIKPEKRPFYPHLTIGRVRRSADQESIRQIGKILSQYKISSLGKVEINELVYYQSVLTPQGPIYTILQSPPLNQV